jgi:hypothetical protein
LAHPATNEGYPQADSLLFLHIFFPFDRNRAAICGRDRSDFILDAFRLFRRNVSAVLRRFLFMPFPLMVEMNASAHQ